MKPTPDKRPIVAPVITDNTPKLGPVAIMAATRPDYQLLATQLGFDPASTRPLFTTNLAVGAANNSGLSLVGPFIGAPYGAMIMETLIAWGARRIIFLGWCGAVAKGVHIGHIILPSGALVDEGTSRHYGHVQSDAAAPSDKLLRQTRTMLDKSGYTYQEGLIWTTDAAFRETPEKVRTYQGKGVLAVEMELSALFVVGKFHGVAVLGLLVVSDEISALNWKPGFKSKDFKAGRHAAASTVQKLIATLI
jgi:purine-nucleoside phosphorylase